MDSDLNGQQGVGRGGGDVNGPQGVGGGWGTRTVVAPWEGISIRDVTMTVGSRGQHLKFAIA